uniref:Uncharacterized protein n=1 Tax=Cucumis melo TaxID=3656 RepID=A0A9I9EBV1_CUCME
MKKTGQLVFTRNQESVPVALESLFGMGQVKGVMCARILEVVLFQGLYEFIHKESDLHVFSFVFVSVIFGATCYMIYEIFINYITEILSLRLEITVCTLVEIEFLVPDTALVSLGLLMKSVNFEIQVQNALFVGFTPSFCNAPTFEVKF